MQKLILSPSGKQALEEDLVIDPDIMLALMDLEIYRQPPEHMIPILLKTIYVYVS